MRGIAASVVVFHHWFNALSMPAEVRRQLFEGVLAPFVNGQGAVQVFFVLSGYVLAASLERGRGAIDWPAFYTKRVFRIQPPYMFAVLFAWCASFAYVSEFGPERGLTHVMLQMSRVHLAPAPLLVALLFPGDAGGQLAVGWTLRVEMIFSLLLPLLAVVARWGRGVPLIAVSLATLLLGESRSDLWYAVDFALGIALQQQRELVAGALQRTPRALQVVWPALGLAILCAPHWLGWAHAVGGAHAPGGVLIAGWDRRDVLVMAPGGALLVAAAATLPAVGRALSQPLLRFLGRISFSLYLLHVPILDLLAPRIVSQRVPGSGYALLVVLVAVVVPASAASHRWVEVPCIALGNRVCRFWAARLGSRVLESHAAESG